MTLLSIVHFSPGLQGLEICSDKHPQVCMLICTISPNGFDLQDLAAALKAILRKLVLGRAVPLINKKKLSEWL